MGAALSMPRGPAKNRLYHVPLWLRLAWREVINNKMFSVAFTLSLSLGLSGFLLLDAFKTSLTAHLDERSRSMLGADLRLAAERPLTPVEEQTLKDQLPSGSRERRELGLLSMVESQGHSRLADIKAVDGDYPFYGSVGLRLAGNVGPGAGASLQGRPSAWVYPELLTQLGAQVGDPLRIGDLDFTIVDVVLHDPSSASMGFSLAPRVFVGIPQLERTALIAKGSRIFRSWLIKLPDSDDDADKVSRTLTAALPASDLRIKPHRGASAEIYRALLHLSDFLGLVTLEALFLAGVGGAYLCRSLLERRSKDIAILLSLGMDLRAVRRVYAAQLALLATAATAVTTALATLLLPLVPAALGALMPEHVAPHLRLSSVALVLLMGVGGSLLTCLPMLARLSSIQPAGLFQEGHNPTLTIGAKQALWWLPVLALFWVLAMVTARGISLGSLFTGIFFAAALVLAGAALLLMLALDRLTSPSVRLVWWLAALSLARHRMATMASFVALGLGALLINLIPQIRGVIEHELAHPSAAALPSLFLFDIQDEQLSPLQQRLHAQQTKLAFFSPLIRARLISINGQSVEDDTSQSSAKGLLKAFSDDTKQELRRGYNLSFRPALSASQELVSGTPVTPLYRPESGNLAQISLEEKFAGRLGLGLGDVLRFDVQGVPTEGVVVNTRRVHWTSFEPNFFIEFQPGLIDDAPKTWVASIPSLPQATKEKIQADLVSEFSNISIIDVSATIERLLGILAQMQRALAFMATLSLASGFTVVFAIARYQSLKRLPDITLLKALGTDFSTLRWTAVAEFGLLGASASGLGAAISTFAAIALAHLLFDQMWSFTWQVPLLSTAALTLTTTLIGLASVWRSLGVSAAKILQEAPQ